MIRGSRVRRKQEIGKAGTGTWDQGPRCGQEASAAAKIAIALGRAIDAALSAATSRSVMDGGVNAPGRVWVRWQAIGRGAAAAASLRSYMAQPAGLRGRGEGERREARGERGDSESEQSVLFWYLELAAHVYQPTPSGPPILKSFWARQLRFCAATIRCA